MYKKIIKKGIILLAVLCGYSVSGQNPINSPFSQYGMGELTNSTTIGNWGAGNTGIGFSNPESINFLNPASYSAIDSMTFIFETSLGTKAYIFNDGAQEANSFNTSFEYMNFAFPITRFWGFAFGIMPFSRTGYDYEQSTVLPNKDTLLYKYVGSKGINQFVMGNSFNIYKGLTIGVNIAYLYGENVFSKESIFQSGTSSNSTIISSINANGFYSEFGAIYKHDFTKIKYIEIGVNYSHNQTLKYKENKIVEMKDVYVPSHNTAEGDTEIPSKIGIGASYTDKSKLTAVIDFSMQDWTQTNIYGGKFKNYLKTSNGVNAGIILHPNQFSAKKYLSRVSYRFGVYYQDVNINLIDKSTLEKYPVSDIGMTLGAKLPFRGTRSTMDLSVRTGHKSTNSNLEVSEKYLFFNIGISLTENWFFKRQID